MAQVDNIEAIKRILEQYVMALADYKIEDSYMLLSRRDRDVISLDAWKESVRKQEDFLGLLVPGSISMSEPVILQDGVATIELSMKFDKLELDEPLIQRVTLVDEGESTWRIYFGSDIKTGNIFEVTMEQ